MNITVVKVLLAEKDGTFHAHSPDLTGLHVCGTDLDEVDADVPRVIQRLFKLNHGLDVEVRAAAGPDLTPREFRQPGADLFVAYQAARAEAR